MDAKISKNKQRKIEIVSDISEKLSKSKAVIFTDYQGLTHKQLENLKKALKAINAEFVVTKNTLLVRALQNDKWSMVNSKSLEGPTAVLFAYDDVIPALKQIAKTIKEFNKPALKFGILDNQALTGEQVLKLSSLPSRDVLLTQIAGGLKSPIYNLHRALNWKLQKLVLILQEIKNQKATSH